MGKSYKYLDTFVEINKIKTLINIDNVISKVYICIRGQAGGAQPSPGWAQVRSGPRPAAVMPLPDNASQPHHNTKILINH